MSELARTLLNSGRVSNAAGETFSVKDSVSRAFGEHLQAAIRDIRPKFSLEIGLAYGISSLFLLDEMRRAGTREHLIIDPYQEQIWKNVGIDQIRQAGYEDLVVFAGTQHPDEVLSRRFLERGRHLDFVFMDGPKRFDLVFYNAYMADRMLNEGGVIYFDDLDGFEGVAKVCRWMNSLPNYEIYRPYYYEGRRGLRSRVRTLVEKGRSVLPGQRRAYFVDESLKPGLIGLGFRKTSLKEAPWNFFADF